MLAFLSANIGTILAGLVVLLIIAGVIIHMIRNKKKGKSACGCGCDGCANASACHGCQKDKQP